MIETNESREERDSHFFDKKCLFVCLFPLLLDLQRIKVKLAPWRFIGLPCMGNRCSLVHKFMQRCSPLAWCQGDVLLKSNPCTVVSLVWETSIGPSYRPKWPLWGAWLSYRPKWPLWETSIGLTYRSERQLWGTAGVRDSRCETHENPWLS